MQTWTTSENDSDSTDDQPSVVDGVRVKKHQVVLTASGKSTLFFISIQLPTSLIHGFFFTNRMA